ncbi:hypothetical protein BH09PAT2_BH09PAT2_08230 [soil metagenome]
MSDKTIVMLAFTIGSTAGGYLPVLWGDSLFSISSIICTAIGGIAGVYVGYKIITN